MAHKNCILRNIRMHLYIETEKIRLTYNYRLKQLGFPKGDQKFMQNMQNYLHMNHKAAASSRRQTFWRTLSWKTPGLCCTLHMPRYCNTNQELMFMVNWWGKTGLQLIYGSQLTNLGVCIFSTKCYVHAPGQENKSPGYLCVA